MGKETYLNQEHTAFNATVYDNDYYLEALPAGIVIDVNNGYQSRGSVSLTIAETKQAIEILKQAVKRAEKINKKNAKKKEAK